MEKNSCLLKNCALKGSTQILELRLEPGEGGILVSAAGEMDSRRFQRQLSVLRGYLALARGGQVPETPVDPAALPQEEGPDALMAVWYDRALRADSTRNGLMAAYNAFGALPGGYPAMERSLEKWLGRELGEKLMTYVNLARQEDDELEGLALELPAWSQEELEAVKRGILAALKGEFSA